MWRRCRSQATATRAEKLPRQNCGMRIREIAQARVRYGYRKIRVLLNREGWKVGKKLVYRLYREEGLGLRRLRQKPADRLSCKAGRNGVRPSSQSGVESGFRGRSACGRTQVPGADSGGCVHPGKSGHRSGPEFEGTKTWCEYCNQIAQERGVPKVLFCDNGRSSPVRCWTCGRITTR